MMSLPQNSKLRTLLLVLSILLAAVALFGAVYVPLSDDSTRLLWAIFALMAFQSHSIYQKGKQS